MQIPTNMYLPSAKLIDIQPRISSKSIAVSPQKVAQPGIQTNRTLDFSNMTPNQMASEMNGLISSGRMSLDESSSLVGMIPTALAKVNYDGGAPSAFGESKNFLAALKSGIAEAKSRNDTANATNLQNALDALNRLQGASSSVASIRTVA